MKKILTLSVFLISFANYAAEVCLVDLILRNPEAKEQGVIHTMRCTREKPFKLEFFAKDKTLEDRQLFVIREFEEVGYQLRTRTVFDTKYLDSANYELVFVKN